MAAVSVAKFLAAPTLATAIDAAVDVAGALPGIPSAGVIRRVAAAADDAVDAKRVGKSWSAARADYWRRHSPTGTAPRREVLAKSNRTGQVSRRTETKELHHKTAQRDGGDHSDANLQEVWPTEHGQVDPHRRPGYTVIKVIP